MIYSSQIDTKRKIICEVGIVTFWVDFKEQNIYMQTKRNIISDGCVRGISRYNIDSILLMLLEALEDR